MTNSFRTPEGNPPRCPICGKESPLEPVDPGGELSCADCQQVLRWLRDRLSRYAGSLRHFTFSTPLTHLYRDSLDFVELVMDMDEEFGVRFSDEDAETMRTVADLVRCLQHRNK